MTYPAHDRGLPYGVWPLGLSRDRAAAYIGVSARKFDEMIADGRMPAPKVIDRRRVWDRHALDAAFAALPDSEEENPWDRMTV